ncbi:MAG: hypothetical protein JWQ43_1307, partial [Glaciihabitans sp.]|nr:hypothetical protein [Glaciihabitans sp.]
DPIRDGHVVSDAAISTGGPYPYLTEHSF